MDFKAALHYGHQLIVIGVQTTGIAVAAGGGGAGGSGTGSGGRIGVVVVLFTRHASHHALSIFAFLVDTRSAVVMVVSPVFDGVGMV